jgi:hypothetical protein
MTFKKKPNSTKLGQISKEKKPKKSQILSVFDMHALFIVLVRLF